LSAANAQNFAGMPGSLFYLMGTLPTGYRPNNNVYFSAQYLFASSIKDDVASDWIKQLNSALNTSGQLYIGWLKPALPATTYSVVVNTILPLD
jgi:hypothetical protein